MRAKRRNHQNSQQEIPETAPSPIPPQSQNRSPLSSLNTAIPPSSRSQQVSSCLGKLKRKEGTEENKRKSPCNLKELIMSYFSRACMAASVAVVRDHKDCGALRSAKSRLLPAGLVPAAAYGANRVLGGETREQNRVQADDSVRQAMYISCWGPS